MHPILLAGAALVGLPILLHLIMKQEPKRLTFPAFRFLTQKLKTNQRKLRLRHFLLLALRMLLIALFCLAVYQPTLKSDLPILRGEQPVAAVLIIDTSPSMGYTANEKTRLEEAIRRAGELLDDLPDKSRVAVIDTADLGGQWGDVPQARRQLESLTKTRGGTQPVTAALARAYQLLADADKEADATEPLPRLVAVFTDRAAGCWDSARVEDLKKLRDADPKVKPAHAVVDVGVDQPVNVAILGAEMKPQMIPANQPAVVTVTVAASGPPGVPPVDVAVVAKLDPGRPDSPKPERKTVLLSYGQSRPLTFEFKNLKTGLHQVEFALEAPDKLMFDNSRFLTFKVGEARRVLTISDDPKTALFWQAAHRTRGEFGCLVVTPDQVVTLADGRTVVKYPDPEKPTETLQDGLRAFDVVCLLDVANPNQPAGNTLWDKLRPFVEGGGKLVIIPGGEETKLDAYEAARDLMPGTLRKVIDTSEMEPPPPPQTAPGWTEPRAGKNGVTWLTDSATVQHPMLRPFQEWLAKGNVDVVRFPPRAWKFWDVAPGDGASVIVRYNDAVKPADRHPAILERVVSDPKDPKRATRGRVLLLTTRMDVPTADSPAWNDYWRLEGSTWFVVFPWLIDRYLAGDTADANFNFLVGQTVTVPLPRTGGPTRGLKVVIDGPGLTGNDAAIEVGDRQTELRIGPPRTNQPGNFGLSMEKWRDGFSLNVPAEESTLDKVPAETIEELTGKNSVIPVGKDLKLRDVITTVLGHPLDLFPWLLIAVLLLLALEGVVANRFYRRVK